ncbi:hypothetical protein [Acidipropionibacterium thoenii]|uniref:hypothetical protein n=1 Tax=Acidipropionibacterium thoenii TaxID=1751 RepID=UPI0004209DC6|nr:hypothetical protein [Acidipropionibacterium thoenii]
MSARGWLLAAAGAAVAGTVAAAVVRAARSGELGAGRTGELAGSRLPVLRGNAARPTNGAGSAVSAGLARLGEQVADLASQARDFVRIVSDESAAKQSELRARLGMDEQG